MKVHLKHKDMWIDFRSDTVTKPSKGMLQAMNAAEIGDDVFEEDPSVHELEELGASMFGMDAALFCPSGTMTNQIAIKALTQPGDEVICDRLSHVYNYEGGGISFHSGASVRLINGDLGRFTKEDVAANINPDNIHYPNTSLVCIENTCNRGGGSIWEDSEIKNISELCRTNKLRLHLDGARVFNAFAETGASPESYGKMFDTISLCLSKGLGAPVGSLLIGDNEVVKKSKRLRKLFGGGMRQSGFLAAAGTFALKYNIARLKEDHQRAKFLEKAVMQASFCESVLPVVTNIIVVKVKAGIPLQDVIHNLEEQKIRVVPFGPQSFRITLHLDITDEDITRTDRVLRSM